MKLYIQLGIIFAIIGTITFFANTRTIIKKSTISDYQKSIEEKDLKLVKLDSTVYSLQQDVDMKQKTDKEFQSVIKSLNDENKDLKKKIIEASMALQKIEANGNVRYFEKKFLQKCSEEVFIKPDCIKTKN